MAFCRSCGNALKPGAKFCSGCGAAISRDEAPTLRSAQGGRVEPPPTQTLPPIPPTSTPSSPPSTPPPIAPPAEYQPSGLGSAPERSGPGRRTGLIVGVAIAALLAGGGIVAAITLPGSSSHPTDISATKPAPLQPDAVPDQTDLAGSTPDSTGVAPPVADNGVLPDVPRSQMKADIRDMLYRWHEDVATGQIGAAWNLLSQARRTYLLEQPGGYPAFARTQRNFGRYLDPSGIHVEIRSLDPNTGVAVVMITGMAWTAPHRICNYWSGITWARYVDGRWVYDEGYGEYPARKREWAPRFGQLLGGSCTEPSARR